MGSERLTQEDELLRQIRLAISSLSTTRSQNRRHKGAMYASSPITSGKWLYQLMKQLGFRSADEFKKNNPEVFQRSIMQPNIANGESFGEILRTLGWPITIVPGKFWAPGWGQNHYMSFWRTVINLFTRNICHNFDWEYSNGCVEEFLIASQRNIDGKEQKRVFIREGFSKIVPAKPLECSNKIRRAIDEIDSMGFDTTTIYDLWREIVLTIDVTLENAHKSVLIKTS